METKTIYREQFDSKKKFNEAVAKEKKAGWAGYVKVDDGNGGVGYKFFESHDDLKLWKNQK